MTFCELPTTVGMSFYSFTWILLYSRLKPILNDADRRHLRHSNLIKLKMIMAFSFNKLPPPPPPPRIPPFPHSRSVKALKSKKEKLLSKYVFVLPPRKQQITSLLSEKDTTWMLRWGNYIVRVHNYIPAQLTKDKLLLHDIDTLTKEDIIMDKNELPSFYWLLKLHKTPYTKL